MSDGYDDDQLLQDDVSKDRHYNDLITVNSTH